MAVSLDDIREYKEFLVEDLYLTVRGEQGIDQSYIDDTFPMPEVREPHIPLRAGTGDKIVSSAAEQLVTSSPQVFVMSDKKTEADAVSKLAREINEIWIPSLQRQNPNIFKEIVKNKIGRGESYLHLVHNESWVTKDRQRFGLPVLFMAPDPMVVYGSPEEDDCGWIPNVGVPNRVIVNYPRQPRDVIQKYPGWSNPENRQLTKNKGDDSRNLVDFWMYWDKDVRYFEADGEPLLKGGVQPNIYGFVPFVRKYSGFGKRSPDGELSDLIVSDIKRSRGLLKEECILRSDISSILHIFAHKPLTIIVPPDTEIDEPKLKRSLNMGSYSVNLLYLPEGSELKWGETILPSREVFEHLNQVKAEIRERYPFLMAGFPMGGSGRQQDMSNLAAMRRYDTVTENAEDGTATAVEMALTIVKKLPKLMPDSLSKKDFEASYRVEVKLRAEDPVENDRLATLGSRLYQQGEIDLKTNLVQYQKKTEAEAEDIITNILVEKVTLQSPEIAELLGLKAAEKAGMAEELSLLRQRRQQAEKQAGGLAPTIGASEMMQRGGETKTPQGFEMIDEALRNKGQRFSPDRYTRTRQ